MLSKNNFKERIRKMDDKKSRFSIRKLSVGAVSVLLGFFLMENAESGTVHADEMKKANNDGNGADAPQVSTKSASTQKVTKVVVNSPKASTPQFLKMRLMVQAA